MGASLASSLDWRKNLKYSNEVANALQKGLPVVALESTIISHGMPYPQNLETAKSVESIVRENKAVPATIGSNFSNTLLASYINSHTCISSK